MKCCDEMDFERDKRPDFDLLVEGRVVYLHIREVGHCIECGASVSREAKVDCGCLHDDVPEEEYEVVEVDNTCGTCGGSGGIPEAPCHACGGRGQ